MTTKEMDKAEAAALVKPGPFLLALTGRGEFPQIDSEAMSARIAAQMLQAETPEELNETGQTTKLEDLFGVPLEIIEAIPRPTRLVTEGGLVGFVIVAAIRLDTGKELIFTTSAQNVATRIAIAADKGWLPGYKLKVRRSEEQTESGFYPYLVENV